MLLIALVACSASTTEPAVRNVAPASRPLSLVGRWRVIGCETSPLDPADCARGEIVFTADRVTIDVPAADQKEFTYTPLSASPRVIAVRIDDEVSNITIDANGEAHWRAPGLDGRVGQLSFVRAP
jgi:hypothetical protein